MNFAGGSFGGWDFVFPVNVGDAIGRQTVHDFDLVEIVKETCLVFSAGCVSAETKVVSNCWKVL